MIGSYWTTLHICWFNFDALAQGNAYKPTKEPINYHGPGGDRTHHLQTEATPPAASCPARTLHATEIASKNATPMTCPWLHWTTDNPSGMHRCQFQHLCVLILNCALALAIYVLVGLILMLWHRETYTTVLMLWAEYSEKVMSIPLPLMLWIISSSAAILETMSKEGVPIFHSEVI